MVRRAQRPLFAGLTVFSGGAAAVFPKIPGEVLQAGKTAETGGFLYLQGFIAQKAFGFFHAYVEQIVFGGCGKEMMVIDVKLALLQIYFLAEAFDTPILLAVGKHFQAQVLEKLVQVFPILLLIRAVKQIPGKRNEHLGNQAVNIFLPELGEREIFHLYFTYKRVCFSGIGRVKDFVFRETVLSGGI